MTKSITIKYEVIKRSVVTTKPRKLPDEDAHASHVQHTLTLLYRGDGTPWWTCSASLNFMVPADFVSEPGDMIEITLKVHQ